MAAKSGNRTRKSFRKSKKKTQITKVYPLRTRGTLNLMSQSYTLRATRRLPRKETFRSRRSQVRVASLASSTRPSSKSRISVQDHNPITHRKLRKSGSVYCSSSKQRMKKCLDKEIGYRSSSLKCRKQLLVSKCPSLTQTSQ